MLRFVLCFILILAFGTQGALADMPREVMTAYKAYNHAVKEKNLPAAKTHALEAWKAAEKQLGDHKSTGDLAMNYGSIKSFAKTDEDARLNYKRRVKAMKRAIDLSKLHETDAGLLEVQRRIDLVDLQLTRASTLVTLNQAAIFQKTTYGKIASIKKLNKAIEKYGLKGSTFDGDTQALFARYYQLNQSPKKALKFANNAIAIYDEADDDYLSPFTYLVHIYKGHSHREIAVTSDNPQELIQSGLSYQAVMKNSIGTLPDTHPFVKTATFRWIKVRKDIEDAGLITNAELAGLCQLDDAKSRKFKTC